MFRDKRVHSTRRVKKAMHRQKKMLQLRIDEKEIGRVQKTIYLKKTKSGTGVSPRQT